MMSWLRHNGEALQGIGAILTALIAVVALAGVKFQIDAQEKVSREQAAREIYREFLALSIANPELADPGTCPDFDDATSVKYDHYLEHLLYTAEEVMNANPEWEGTFTAAFATHGTAICSETDWSGYTTTVQTVVADVRQNICAKLPACPATDE